MISKFNQSTLQNYKFFQLRLHKSLSLATLRVSEISVRIFPECTIERNMCETTSSREKFLRKMKKNSSSLNTKKKKMKNFLCRKAVENDLLNCNKSVGTPRSKTINQPCVFTVLQLGRGHEKKFLKESENKSWNWWEESSLQR